MVIHNRVPYHFSRDVQNLQRSVMRELLKKASTPGVISLAGGLPDTRLLPAEDYRDCLDTVLAREGGAALQYRPQYDPLREWIADYMRGRGVECTADNIFITNGNQQGLSILSRLFVEADAPVVIEEISFTGIQQVTAGRGAHVLRVMTDLQNGIDVDAVEALFAEYHPRMAVVVPDFHNPLGVSISAEKRARLAKIAARYQVPVVEDDPYSPLRFGGDITPPVTAYDHDGWVFYLGSFSKMLAPGLRLGWIVAPVDLMPRITVVRESMDLETAALTQRAVYEYLSRGLLTPHLEQLNATNRERCTAMLDTLQTHLADIATWTHPAGGLFVWLTLPEHLNAWELLPEALEQHHVAFVPGGAFAVDGRSHTNTIRLNFSAVSADEVRIGVERLAQMIRQHA